MCRESIGFDGERGRPRWQLVDFSRASDVAVPFLILR